MQLNCKFKQLERILRQMTTVISTNNANGRHTLEGGNRCNNMNDVILANDLVLPDVTPSVTLLVNHSPLSDLGKIIAKKYRSRSLQPTDPTPILINCDTSGPLNVTKGFIMCDTCGSIIRRNYLTSHRNSGACARLAEKREQQNKDIQRNNSTSQQSIGGTQACYTGPYVHLSINSDNITI